MKKITLSFLLFLFTAGLTFSQTTLINVAPPNNSTSSFRLPNGSSASTYFRGATLVLASELTAIPSATSITSIGFIPTTGASSVASGTITIYAQNSTDTAYNKGTTWAGITPGMTVVYSGPMTIPNTATPIDLTLTTPLTYSGGSIYLAYDWTGVAPFATTGAVWGSNNTGLIGGCASMTSSTAPPTSGVTSSFRPSIRFGTPNPYSNDVSVESINTLGNVATTLGLPVTVSALVRNKSNIALTNINVSANMTGANTYADSQSIASLAAGASTTVNFANWIPTALGANVLSVTVPSDQVNTNNSLNFNTTTSCFTSGAAQNPSTYPNSIGFNTASGILSTPLQNTVATTITDVNIAISTNTASVGNNVYGVILNNSGAILATSTNTLTIANGDLGTIKTFTFTPNVSLAANQLVHIGMAQTANATTGYYPFGSYNNANLTTVYNTCAIAGGALSPTTNLGQFGIEAVFSGSCFLGVEEAVTLDNYLRVYPNPASTVLNVKLTSFNENVNLEVYNVLGQIVIPLQKMNNDSFELNVSSLNKGVYFLKVNNENKMSTVKFAIEK